jgi:hypothetical protein
MRDHCRCHPDRGEHANERSAALSRRPESSKGAMGRAWILHFVLTAEAVALDSFTV